MASLVPHNWEVPAIFRERLGSRAGRQRVMAADGHLLIILHELTEPGDTEPAAARLFWRRPDGGWRASGTTTATISTLRSHVEAFATAIDQLEARAAIATCAKDWFDIMHAAAPLQRTVRGQSATLQEVRELVKSDRDLISLRDMAQESERAIELIIGHARAGLDYTIAASAEHNARNSEHVLQSQHRLNLIAATFLPISALGALLGMNLHHGLEDTPPQLFWLVAFGALVVGMIVRATLPKARA
jgi:Mg2+ and Co2+ transporter CorA